VETFLVLEKIKYSRIYQQIKKYFIILKISYKIYWIRSYFRGLQNRFEKILDNSNILEELKNKNLFFSYFQVDRNYYMLIIAEKSFDKDFLYKVLTGIRELNTKQRRIRSFRGFLIYALEIQKQGNNFEILKTNLKSYFWKEIENIIRQNRKPILLNFLLESSPEF
jgi:hypothetical protein